MADRLKRLLVIVLVLVGLDQLTKALAVHYIGRGGRVPVIPGLFDLVLWENTGAAFGFLAGLPGGRWLLAALSIAALVAAAWLGLKHLAGRRAMLWSISLIAGGAAGNLIDRLRTGLVTDFALLYYKQWYWPAFNLADSAITVGGVWLAVLLLRGK